MAFDDSIFGSPGFLPAPTSTGGSTTKVMVHLDIEPGSEITSSNIVDATAAASTWLDELEFTFASSGSFNSCFSKPTSVTVVSAHPLTGRVAVPKATLDSTSPLNIQWELELHGNSNCVDMRGSVQCIIRGESLEIPWQLILRPNTFMSPMSRPCSADTFASIVANPADFPYTGTGSFILPLTWPELLTPVPDPDQVRSVGWGQTTSTTILRMYPMTRLSLFLDFLARQLTGLQIVECIGPVASLYGRSVHEAQAAGLLKVQKIGSDGSESPFDADMAQCRVTVEIKSSDKMMLTSLLDAIHQVFPPLSRRY
ncbi:hypothetical protein BJ085DRAFT_41094 [Dimargaris cristalligena]|uniref:Uncharacterized protein n=1 Tax=Dimargaris cristalligena TaxID=215637 RepID=A0A4P9ZNV8_9FUNG|nr:hypothetical protein BJ085DRAFT_41094 [Dimargaris cristalligena]|eukprot:RKP34010.1 hypothetical protein BJ085DRAFT_41094 [Dimargaris cristalligena]